jgi:hypothetical protein
VQTALVLARARYNRDEQDRRMARRIVARAQDLRQKAEKQDSEAKLSQRRLIGNITAIFGTGLLETGAASGVVAKVLGTDERAVRELAPELGTLIGQAFGRGEVPSQLAQETGRIPGAIQREGEARTFLQESLRNAGVDPNEERRILDLFEEQAGFRGPRLDPQESFRPRSESGGVFGGAFN